MYGLKPVPFKNRDFIISLKFALIFTAMLEAGCSQISRKNPLTAS
jgi:hypothetical protein